MVEAFIGIGSNLGNKKENVLKAMELLRKSVKISKVSSLYETEPMYYTRQENFINCVVKIDTDKKPRELLKVLQDIENEMGSKKLFKYGPRIIDLDLLAFGKAVLKEDDLEIPHPLMHERPFVLIPFAEIEPKFIHPVLRKRISELTKEVNANIKVLKI